MPAPADVDQFFAGLNKWRPELLALRSILMETTLDEQIKWRQPCYSHQGKNVAIIGALKNCCTLSFFQGVLLQDPKKVLQLPGPNSQTARVIKFTDVEQILDSKSVLLAYLKEAIELVDRPPIEKAKEPAARKNSPTLPDELQDRIDQDPQFAAAYKDLTPGRQRGYLLHFSAAKQSKTRADRIEKCRSRILAGRGLHDCICGLSKRMPNCDGSHKDA